MFSRIRGSNRRGQARGTRAERDGGTLAILWQTFIKENKVIPPVLAVISLLIFSWVVAGAFISGSDDSVSSSQSLAPNSGEVAQSETSDEAATSVPEIDNPNAESFAAYESKDPFRTLFTPASTEDENDDGTDGSEGTGGSEGTNGSDTDGGSSDFEGTNSGGGDGGRPLAEDGDSDGESNDDSYEGDSGDGGDEDSPRSDTTSAPTNTPADAQYGAGEGDYSGDDIGNDRSGSGGNPGDGPGDPRDDFGREDELFDSGGDLPDPVR